MLVTILCIKNITLFLQEFCMTGKCSPLTYVVGSNIDLKYCVFM